MTTDFKDAFQLGQSAVIKTVNCNGIDHVLIPPNCELKSMEHLMPAPVRIKCHPKFGDIASFKSYIEEFQVEGSRIFVDEDKLRFVTVFDFHTKEGPAWGDHSASMQLEQSHEWLRFKSYDGKALKPADFAELLEDNLQYVNADDLSGGDLLTMAQSFKIQLKGEVNIDETLHAGLKTLLIKDDSVVSGQRSNGKEVSFPEKLTFALRIYKNQERFPISVFLRYRKADSKLVFFIKIPDTDDIEEQAFDRVIEKVKSETGLPTLKGAFAGPSHK